MNGILIESFVFYQYHTCNILKPDKRCNQLSGFKTCKICNLTIKNCPLKTFQRTDSLLADNMQS